MSRWQAWPASARRTFVLALFALPVVAVVTRFFGPALVRRALVRVEGARKACMTAEISAIAQAVNAAARRTLLPNGNCLPRALLLEWLLARRGVATEFRLGVRVVDGLADGHAWLEIEGQPINDHPAIAATYPPLESRSAK